MIAKAQSSLEYLLIVALVLGLIIPITYLFFRYGSQSNEQIIDSQINQIGNTVVDTAEIVYYSGEGAKIILELKIPESIDSVDILGDRELVFTRSSEIGENQMVFFSSVDIPIKSDAASLLYLANSGLKRIRIQAVDPGTGLEVRIEKT
ncbi:MAG: hypothetical protein IIC69_01500 [Nanoarchaeota archaeon]|nr:hypothetical protein [Nanoarchaeota archaeon]